MNHLLPNPSLQPHGDEMMRWISSSRRRLGPQGIASLLDPLSNDLFTSGIQEIGGSEGTIWIVDEVAHSLVPIFNTGPHAAQFVGHFVQPLNRGLISMVFANELSICESDMEANRQKDSSLDNLLGVQTTSMLASPISLAGAPIGVLSAVKLGNTTAASEKPRFAPESIKTFERLAEVLQRVWEWQLMRAALGLSDQ